ncbi:MAG TPA: ApaG domain [Chitinophagaceae bacterium]|nr:ApaG domain [Chitinophagaceae bacterium]
MVEMVKQITSGVTVSVEFFYQPEYSKPLKRIYRFAYRIMIANNNSFPIKWLERKWFIIDSHSTERKEEEGKEIGGIQPIIPANETYSYASSVNLNTGVGKMYGILTMKNREDNNIFDVIIPEIIMTAPLKMN